jgi:hypothetical protein
MSATGAPLCRLCGKEHHSREPHILPANAPAEKRSNRTPAPVGEAPKGGERRPGRSGDCLSSRLTAQAGETPAKNTSREGRRVLKAEAARPDATRSASTEKSNPPPPPPAKAGKRTKAEKVTPGKPKTAPKKKAKKKGKK